MLVTGMRAHFSRLHTRAKTIRRSLADDTSSVAAFPAVGGNSLAAETGFANVSRASDDDVVVDKLDRCSWRSSWVLGIQQSNARHSVCPAAAKISRNSRPTSRDCILNSMNRGQLSDYLCAMSKRQPLPFTFSCVESLSVGMPVHPRPKDSTCCAIICMDVCVCVHMFGIHAYITHA